MSCEELEDYECGRSLLTVWRTRDGREVQITEMGDDHLASAIRMIRRRPVIRRLVWVTTLGMAFRAMAYAADAPDGASMAAEEEANSLLDRGLTHEAADDLIAQVNLDFAALRVEAVRRGLEVGE